MLLELCVFFGACLASPQVLHLLAGISSVAASLFHQDPLFHFGSLCLVDRLSRGHTLTLWNIVGDLVGRLRCGFRHSQCLEGVFFGLDGAIEPGLRTVSLRAGSIHTGLDSRQRFARRTALRLGSAQGR